MSEYQLTDYKTKLTELEQDIGKHLQPFTAGNEKAATGWQQIQDIYAQKLEATKPEVMIYGIFNAGKSSIINELLGEDKAETNDVPTTHIISRYAWQGYQLTDTPGVGAPVDDEQVTQEHLRRADVVIFVMSTTGSNEKRDNYERMRDIAAAGKKIIIVLNDKNGESPENIQAIKFKVIENMKAVGITRADQYIIVTVNARCAQKGRHLQTVAQQQGDEAKLRKAENLLVKSNMRELSKVIMQELRKTDTFAILANATQEVGATLEEILTGLEAAGADGETDEITALLQQLRERRQEIRQNMAAFIDDRADRLGHELPGLIWSMRDSSQQQVTDMMNEKVAKTARLVQKQLEIELRDLVNDLLDDAESIQVQIEKLSFTPDEIKKPELDVGEKSSFDAASLMNGLRDVLEKLKLGLDGSVIYNADGSPNVKDVGSSLIGGKLAGAAAEQAAKSLIKTSAGKALMSTVLGKTILGNLVPVVGPVVSIATVLAQLLGGSDDSAQRQAELDRQNALARRQAELEAQVRTELEQKCQYMAADLADTFKVSIDSTLQQMAAEIAKPFKTQASQLKERARQAQVDLAALRDALEQCRMLETSLRASTGAAMVQ